MQDHQHEADGSLPQSLLRALAQQRERPRIEHEGVQALQRLLRVALRDTGQSSVTAQFLLSLYNGYRFKFDLTEFRRLDHDLFEDCMAVLRMDYQPSQEVHCYFEGGGEIWEQLARDWNVRDHTKVAQ